LLAGVMASRERAEAVMRQDWEYLKNFEAAGISCDLACASLEIVN